MATSLRGGLPTEVGCGAQFYDYANLVSIGALTGLNLIALGKGIHALDRVIVSVAMAVLLAEITQPKIPSFAEKACDLYVTSITKHWPLAEALQVAMFAVQSACRYGGARFHGSSFDEEYRKYNGGSELIVARQEWQKMRDCAIRAAVLCLSAYLFKTVTKMA